MPSRTTTVAAAHLSLWVGCTLLRFLTKPPPMPTQSFSVRARILGPNSLKIFVLAGRRAVMNPTCALLSQCLPFRRDLIRRRLYLVPNSIVVSRGCPHVCDFCYKEAFFSGGKSFYTLHVDDALAEIERLPGRHLYFLDDHHFGNARSAGALCDGMN